MKTKAFLAFTLIIFLLACSQICTVHSVETDVEDILAQAEQRVIEVYLVIIEAEHVGAEVHHLVDTLNEQVFLLNLAKETLQLGDDRTANQYALSVIESSDWIAEEAVALKDEAFSTIANRRSLYLSAVPVIAILSGLIYFHTSRLWDRRRKKSVQEKKIDFNEGEDKRG